MSSFFSSLSFSLCNTPKEESITMEREMMRLVRVLEYERRDGIPYIDVRFRQDKIWEGKFIATRLELCKIDYSIMCIDKIPYCIRLYLDPSHCIRMQYVKRQPVGLHARKFLKSNPVV